MEKTYIIANWKSNKTLQEAEEWINAIGDLVVPEGKEVIVCAPFTLLSFVAKLIKEKNLPIKLGAQNISSFDAGSYTGEINAFQLAELVEYVIIGHSERRKYQKETDEDIQQKFNKAVEHNLMPILCVQDETTPVPQGTTIVAYEPISAIGTGNADSPEDAENVAKQIKEKTGATVVIYGGSVTSENARSFTTQENISGHLIGKASLDPQSFQAIIQNA